MSKETNNVETTETQLIKNASEFYDQKRNDPQIPSSSFSQMVICF